MIIQNSRPTQAESLLYTVGCVVKGLLSSNCPTNNPQQTNPAPSEQPQPPPDTPTTTEPTTPTGQPQPSTQPIELTQEVQAQLPKIPEVKTQPYGSSVSGFVLPSARGFSTSSASVLGARDIAPIRATSQGWSIVGVPWYWWLVTLGGVVGLYFGVKALIDRSFLMIVEQRQK